MSQKDTYDIYRVHLFRNTLSPQLSSFLIPISSEDSLTFIFYMTWDNLVILCYHSSSFVNKSRREEWNPLLADKPTPTMLSNHLKLSWLNVNYNNTLHILIERTDFMWVINFLFKPFSFETLYWIVFS